MKTYKDLLVWQKSFKLTIKILDMVDGFPKGQKTKIISDQMLRSVMSIGANISEGYGRRQGKEMEQFFQYAIGSANETDYWLNICKSVNLISAETFNELTGTCMEIIKMLGAFISKSKSFRN